MNIITGYRGEPHITAQQDRDFNLGMVGNSLTELYVMYTGQCLDFSVISANEVRIRDGVLVMQGCSASINYGAYDSLAISNGSQGMKRIDIIAAQYERNSVTNVESISLVVVEGTPDVSDPQPPALTGGNIAGGDTLVQMPLYYVHLDGINIELVERRFLYARSIKYNNTITYSDFSGNNYFTAPYNGFMVLTIEPSNTSNATVYIQDLSDELTDLCKLSSSNGLATSCSFPIIKGNIYKIRSASVNVQDDSRCYARCYKLP